MAIREEIRMTVVQQQSLLDLKEDIEWLEREIVKAERAGIDVTDIQTKLRDLVKLREGLLREYS